MELTYQAAGQEDIVPICQLSRQLILDYEDMESIDFPKVMAWVQKKVARSIQNYTAVFCGGVKAGYYHFYQNDDGVFEIDDLYIFPEFQNRGIGSQIVRTCCASVDSPVMLYAFSRNKRAISLYERLGFRVIQTLDNSRCIMQKEKEEIL